MKANRNSNKRIVFNIISIVILCIIVFSIGYYCGTQKNNEKVNDNTASVTPGEAMNNSGPSVTITDTPVKPATVTEGAGEPTITPLPGSIIYHNKDYGFDFALPVSWDGYTIQTDKWQGTAVDGDNSGEELEAGPIIMIRHPKWTKENPRQDIPIMVFTLKQWKLIEKEEMAVSAAPIGPSKLGSNTNYVFALPARYNYAFPEGYEEVEDILKNNPLTTAN